MPARPAFCPLRRAGWLSTWVLAALTAPLAAGATEAACPAAGELPGHLAEREHNLARLQRLPNPCLKGLFQQCSHMADRGMLEGSSALSCLLAYEALLRGSFRGDFQALMDWWRAQRQGR